MPFYNAQPKGRPITILDEGVSLTTNVAQIDFVGAGVVGTTSGNNVTATISGAPGTLAYQETPSGTINGVNAVFTLANTPVASTLDLYLNGQWQTGGGVDYTLSVATVTFVVAPPTSSGLKANYSY